MQRSTFLIFLGLLVSRICLAQDLVLEPVPAPPENPVTESKHILGKLLFWDGRAREVLVDPLTDEVVIPTGAALESQALVPIISSIEMGHGYRHLRAYPAAGRKPVRPLCCRQCQRHDC